MHQNVELHYVSMFALLAISVAIALAVRSTSPRLRRSLPVKPWPPAPLRSVAASFVALPPPRASRLAVSAAPAPAPPAPLPRTILFLDVETTGLSHDDRIVSLGAIKLRLTPPGEMVALHLVFNPERRCCVSATQWHRFDSRTLARQDPFAGYAAPLREWCGEAELVVAHNAAFDLRFVNSAFLREGVPALTARVECTMLAARARGEGPASLEAASQRIGLPMRGLHGALPDAWRCMQVFLWQRGLPWRLDYGWLGSPGPANYREAPPSCEPAPLSADAAAAGVAVKPRARDCVNEA